MHGRYEEAAEIYKPEAAANAQAALGWAACLESQGKTAAAVEALKPLADKQAEIQAQLARLAFERGDSVEARRRAEEALQLASEHPLALYILAELARTSGRLDEAEDRLSPLDRASTTVTTSRRPSRCAGSAARPPSTPAGTGSATSSTSS